MFYSNDSRSNLQNAKTWLVDGTYKVCPSPFYQLYTIHGFLFGRCYPLVYVLCKSKTKKSYLRIFSQLYFKNNDLPNNIIFDFEVAAIEAAK
jgi:hypothetical protein